MKEEAPHQEYKSAPGTNIYYDPGLIDKLKSDHKVLLGVFTRLVDSAKEKKFEKAKQYISELDNGLRAHLLLENIKLYVYLVHAQANNQGTSAIIQEFRDEMDAIGRVVTSFINKYKKADFSNEQIQADLVTDLGVIGGALVDRIKREEQVLYPIYMPL